MDSPRGIRKISTFKNEPKQSPKMIAVIISMLFSRKSKILPHFILIIKRDSTKNLNKSLMIRGFFATLKMIAYNARFIAQYRASQAQIRICLLYPKSLIVRAFL